jgi:hypothetical protein
MSNLKMSDDTIAQIAKMVQLAILTGTDIVDNLRVLELVEDGGVLNPAPEFLERIEENISSLMEEAESATSETAEEG